MNFDEINKIYNHMVKYVYPNVVTRWKNVSTEDIIVDKYLEAMGDSSEYSLLAIPYLLDAEGFLKKYKNNCIIYYNTPDPSDGLLLTIHQITPKIHIHSRVCVWVEAEKTYDYITSLILHKDAESAKQFVLDNYNLAKSGNTEDSNNKMGFITSKSDHLISNNNIGFK